MCYYGSIISPFRPAISREIGLSRIHQFWFYGQFSTVGFTPSCSKYELKRLANYPLVAKDKLMSESSVVNKGLLVIVGGKKLLLSLNHSEG